MDPACLVRVLEERRDLHDSGGGWTEAEVRSPQVPRTDPGPGHQASQVDISQPGVDGPDHDPPGEGAPKDGGEVGVDVHDLVPSHLSPGIRNTVEPAATQLRDPDRSGENSPRVETDDWTRGDMTTTGGVLITQLSPLTDTILTVANIRVFICGFFFLN